MNGQTGQPGQPMQAPQPMQPTAAPPPQFTQTVPSMMMMTPQPGMMAPPMYPPQQMPMQAMQATGVAVQIEIETPSGKATAFLNYGPEWAASSAAMKQLIGALQMAGFPVKAWQPKGQRGGGW